MNIDQANIGASRFGEESVSGLQLKRMDELISHDQLARTSVIKIDVEGMEHYVLHSLLELEQHLAHDVTIFVEIVYGPESNAILAEFMSRGFRAYVIRNTYTIDDFLEMEIHQPVLVDSLGEGMHDVMLVRGEAHEI